MTTETYAQKVARENKERWLPIEVTDVARSRRVLLAAFSCNRCGALYAIGNRPEAEAQRQADICCGPWECSGCGAPYVKDGQYRHYAPSYCSTCSDRQRVARYNALPLEDEGYSGPIVAGDRFYPDLGSFLDDCDGDDEDPYSHQPETCEPATIRTIDLAETICERSELDTDDDSGLDFLAPVQKALDEAIAAHNASGHPWWFGSGKRPRIPENWRDDYPTT